jgi:hypothetical protein
MVFWDQVMKSVLARNFHLYFRTEDEFTIFILRLLLEAKAVMNLIRRLHLTDNLMSLHLYFQTIFNTTRQNVSFHHWMTVVLVYLETAVWKIREEPRICKYLSFPQCPSVFRMRPI